MDTPQPTISLLAHWQGAKIFWLVLLYLTATCGCVSLAYGQVVMLKQNQTTYSFPDKLSYQEDLTDTLRIDQLLYNAQIAQFKPLPSEDGNLGFKNTVHWAKFQVINTSPLLRADWLLELGYSAYAEVDLYIVNKSNRIVFHQEGGDWRGTRSRPISFHNFVFNLPLESNSIYTVFLRVKPLAGQVMIPITVWETKAFIDYAILYHIFWGIYIGMLLIVLLYHAIVYCFNWKQKEYNGYLLLSVYLLTYLIFELTRGGCIGVRYLWPNASWWVNNGFVISFFVMMIMFIAFYGIILDIPSKMKRLTVVLEVLVSTAIVALLFIVVGWWQVSKNAASFAFGGIAGFLLMVAAYKSWRSEVGNQSVRFYYTTGFYYLIAAFTLYSSGIIMILHRTGVIRGSDFFKMNSLNVGSIIEFIALSIGLALRIRWQREENKRLEMEKQKAVMETKHKEVERMTSAIHDYFGSQALSLQYKVKSIYQDYIDTLNKKRMEEVSGLIGEILDGIRLMAHSYMPYRLGEKGLRMALFQMIQQYNEFNKVKFESHFSGTEEGLSNEVQEELYYIVLELLTNVHKHSRANTAALITYDESDLYCLQVKDDGVGLTTDPNHRGRGLENIKDRVNNINGNLHIISEPDRGTTFLVKIPFLD